MTTQKTSNENQDVAQLVEAARDGCPKAWMELVNQYSNLVWHVVRSFRLDDSTAHDVAQATWLSAVEKLHQVRRPERFGSWIAAVARHAATAEYHRAKRHVLMGDDIDRYETAIEPVDRVVEQEEREALAGAFTDLAEEEQQLLRLTVTDGELSYEDIAWALGRPVGSIGPSRARALTKLRHKYEAAMSL